MKLVSTANIQAIIVFAFFELYFSHKKRKKERKLCLSFWTIAYVALRSPDTRDKLHLTLHAIC